MPRPSNTRERRALVVQAFMRVVASKGYAGATMTEVAAQAGLAPGLIHYHFESKEEILLESFRYLTRLIRERMHRRVHPTDDARKRLQAFIDAHLALDGDANQVAVACWVVLSAEAIRSPVLGRLYRRMVRWQLGTLRRIIRQIPDRRLSESETQRVAAAIVASIQGYFQVATTTPRAIPKGTAATSVRQMARGLLL